MRGSIWAIVLSLDLDNLVFERQQVQLIHIVHPAVGESSMIYCGPTKRIAIFGY